MIIFPYKADTPVQKIPVINILLSALILIVSILFYYGKLDLFFVDIIMQPRWSPVKAIASILIQPGRVSIIVVFLFFFFFGNAINSSHGNIKFLIIICALILVSSIVHPLTSRIPPIGAHAVVTGLAGFIIASLPANKILLYKPDLEEETGFSLISLIVLWLAFDIYSAFSYLSIVNVITQAVCLFAGIIIAVIFIKFGLSGVGTPTFMEWINDRLAGVSNSEIITGALHGARKKTGQTDIKSKAEKLMELYEIKIQDDDTINIGTPAPLPVEEEKELKFRILKTVPQKDHITLYFVYSGKSITDIFVKSENYKCEIYPSHALNPGESGSITIYLRAPADLNTIYLNFNYKLNGKSTAKEINYSTSSNEISG